MDRLELYSKIKTLLEDANFIQSVQGDLYTSISSEIFGVEEASRYRREVKEVAFSLLYSQRPSAKGISFVAPHRIYLIDYNYFERVVLSHMSLEEKIAAAQDWKERFRNDDLLS